MKYAVDLRTEAPAALATSARQGLSHRYSFLPTSRVLDALKEDGWGVAAATQGRSRVQSRAPFAKHQIILVEQKILAKGYDVFTEVPRIILTNSHDGNSKYLLQAGLYKTACFNGLYIPDGVIQSVAIRHSNRTIEECVEAADNFRQNAELITEHVDTFRKVELSHAATVEFAKQAIEIRFRHDPEALVAMDDVLTVKRDADVGNDLWRVFNRVQEHLISGGFPVYRETKDGQWTERNARAIKAIDENSRINVTLWSLAEQFSLN